MSHEQSRSVSLALQGGGAHGAFTWGVLDALLEAEFTFDGVSGTSAGAMNAVCLAQGLMVGGRDGAREALRNFWTAVAASSPFTSMFDENGKASATAKMMAQWANYLTPEQINPLDINPLRDIIEKQIDFAALRKRSPIRLFIAATHANSGKLRIFHNDVLSADALLASACLPTIHRTIYINKQPYWDGGYSANPAVFPLVYDCDASDILLVLLTPLRFQETPVTADHIRERLGELAFNSTFLREMRMFAHMREYATRSRLPAWLVKRLPHGRLGWRVSDLRFHAISAEKFLGAMPAESKGNMSMDFFTTLFDEGRAVARRWLRRNRDEVGRNPTLNLTKVFY